jgi:hypothetical protein
MHRTLRSLCAPSRRRCSRLGICLIALLLSTHFWADAYAETTAPATNSPEIRQEAASAIPFDQLTPDAQAKVGAVVSRPTIYRRLPTETISCDGQMYLMLVRNPDIVVNIWQLMDVTEVTMDRIAPFCYTSDDKAGTLSQIEMLFGTPQIHIFYATTHYEGPMFARPVNARVVLLLRSDYARAEDGSPRITSVMDAFIRIDHLTANIVARTLSPVVGKTADHNFVESFRFLERVSETAEANGPGVQQLAKKLEKVDPLTRQQFADVAGAVAERAVRRMALDAPVAPVAIGAPTHASSPIEPRTISAAAQPSPTSIVRPAPAAPPNAEATVPLSPRSIQLRR